MVKSLYRIKRLHRPSVLLVLLSVFLMPLSGHAEGSSSLKLSMTATVGEVKKAHR